MSLILGIDKKDGRQKAAAEALCRFGYTVISPSTEQKADVLITAMPFAPSQEEQEYLCKCVCANGVVLSGMPNHYAVEYFQKNGIEVIDYAQREELTLLNAIPTAEGCLQILMQMKPKTIWNSNVLIVGFGRIAKLLVRDLMAMGAKVTVAARNPAQRAEATAWGCKAVDLKCLAKTAAWAESIINTVPYCVFCSDVLKHIQPECALIDLASTPGGFDFDAADKLGLCIKWARGLPPVYAPVTAGEILAQTIQTILRERGYVQ